MLSKLKYLFLYAYEATEKMEEKAEAFAEERQKRMETFRAEHEAAKERAKQTMEDIRADVRNQVGEALQGLGVATKGEMDELKAMVGDLAIKIDDLSK